MSSTTPENTANATAAIPEEMRCKYIQSICTRERAFKVSGGRHHLCAYHRDNANTAQQRFVQKSREERRRQILLRLAKKKALEEQIKSQNCVDTTDLPSDLTCEMSDRTPLGEITDDDILQLEKVLSSDEEFEWLRAALLQTNNYDDIM